MRGRHRGYGCPGMAKARMNVKDAARMAKEYVAELLAEEQIRDIAIEETKFQHGANTWLITVGFFRPWHQGVTRENTLDQDRNLLRSYKAVRINDRIGRVEWVRDRFAMEPFDPADIDNDTIEAKAVVQTARELFADFFAGENIKGIGLEKTKYNYDSDTWEITIGFLRVPENGSRSDPLGTGFDKGFGKRSYKTICIDNESGSFQGIKDRFMIDSSPSAQA